MRLLYLCSDFGIPPAGSKGASIHLRAITRSLAELGHRITLLSPRGGPGPGHPADTLSLPNESSENQRYDALRRWLRDRDLPVSVAAEWRAVSYNARLSDEVASQLRKCPPAAILERLSLFGHGGLDLARTLKVPLIVEVNAPLTREAKTFRDLEMHALARRIESRVLQQADAVAVVSSELGDELTTAGLDAAKVHVVPNGTNVEAFDPQDDGAAIRRAHGLDGQFVIGFCGSLKRWHGVDLLLRAFEKFRAAGGEAKLLVVGTGPTEKELRKQAADAGLGDSAVFTGAVDHGEIPKYLAAMDVTVAPFRAVDGFYFSPIKLFEYMAAGRLIVASRLGQIERVIVDGEHGLLCAAEDVGALTEALQTAHRDAALRERLGASARKRVEQSYTWGHAARHIEEMIEEALRSRGDGVKSGDGPRDMNVAALESDK